MLLMVGFLEAGCVNKVDSEGTVGSLTLHSSLWVGVRG